MSNIIKSNDLDCSVKSLLEVAFPMIISILSGTLMQILDRAFLAHYSSIAMNSASVAQQASGLIILPLLCFATISEVFVGQFNGAGQFKKASMPIFQIARFLIIFSLIICPIALKYSHFLIAGDLHYYGYQYFFIMMVGVPFSIIHSSLAAFFVGTRRTKIILYSVLISNLVNFSLDIILIFGIKDFIPAMGVSGAAIATLVSIIMSSVILLVAFFNKHNSKHYNTRVIKTDKEILKKNILIGAPVSFAYLVEMSIWLGILNSLALISIDEVTVQNVCVALLIFFLFIIDGLQKGVMALASNCIGAKKDFMIEKLIKSVFKTFIFVAIIIAIPLLVYPEQLLKYVFKVTETSLLQNFKSTFVVLFLSLTFAVISSSCFGGILNSGGDTKFVTFVKISSMVFFVAIPASLFYFFGTFTSFKSWCLGFLQQIVNCTCYYIRYKSGKWKHNLINNKQDNAEVMPITPN